MLYRRFKPAMRYGEERLVVILAHTVRRDLSLMVSFSHFSNLTLNIHTHTTTSNSLSPVSSLVRRYHTDVGTFQPFHLKLQNTSTRRE